MTATDLVATGRIVIVDPREERRAITNLMISGNESLTVVGVAGSLDEAEARVRDGNADIALVEIQMPVPAGLAAVRGLRARFPDLRIIVCSFHGDTATRNAAYAEGADGYLAKPLQVEELLRLTTRTGVSDP